MGVQFDRILDAFSGPFERIEAISTPAGLVTEMTGPAGYLFTHQANDAFTAVNQLLAAGESVFWITEEVRTGGKVWDPGTHFVPAGERTRARLEQLARTIGIDFHALERQPGGRMQQLRQRRVALLDRYGGSMASGWIRLVLEQFRFPHSVVYPRMLEEAELIDHFDVLVLPDDTTFEDGSDHHQDTNIPAEYAERAGRLTTATTIPQLRRFVEAGGVLLALGDATRIADYLGLGVTDALVEANGRRLPSTRFYIPGSLVEARIDRLTALGYGLASRVDFFFDNSPVFRIAAEARAKGVRPIAWFDSDKPLRSGWALGQAHLKDAAAVVEAPVGKGRLVLYGPHITFRAQSHGTFKLLFNAMY
jgi:hypothetical protein